MSEDAGDFFERYFSGDDDPAAAQSFPAPDVPEPPPTSAPDDELARLVAYALRRFRADNDFPEFPSVVESLRKFNRGRIAQALDRAVGTPHDPAAEGMSLRIFLELGPLTEEELRRQWAAATLDTLYDVEAMPRLARDSVPLVGAAESLALALRALGRLGWPARPGAPAAYFGLPFAFRYALQDHVPRDLLLGFVLELMNRLPPDRLAANVLHALSPFRDRRVLDWMESHATAPVTYEWGAAAAVSRVSWDRICRWLDRGEPLSLIALDALKNCRGFDPGDPEMSGIFKVVSPKIEHPAAQKKMRKKLTQFARKNPSPRVKEAVALILEHLPDLVAP